MEVNWVYSKPYRTCEWIWRLAYVNLLWIFSTVVGLIAFGLLPATVAMFVVLRKWVMGEPNIPILKTFITTYKKEFIKANLLGLIFAGVGYTIYFNYSLVGALDGSIQTVVLVGLLCTTFSYLIILLFIFPVYVHYHLKIYEYIKVAFIIGIHNPLEIIILVLSWILLYQLFYFIPGLIPFFSMSLPGLITMWHSKRIFIRIEKSRSCER